MFMNKKIHGCKDVISPKVDPRSQHNHKTPAGVSCVHGNPYFFMYVFPFSLFSSFSNFIKWTLRLSFLKFPYPM